MRSMHIHIHAGQELGVASSVHCSRVRMLTWLYSDMILKLVWITVTGFSFARAWIEQYQKDP